MQSNGYFGSIENQTPIVRNSDRYAVTRLAQIATSFDQSHLASCILRLPIAVAAAAGEAIFENG
jgi:hypothetical protein